MLALVGESGSGKSVSCRSIMGLLPKTATVTGGEILLDGINVLGLDAAGLRRIRGKEAAMIFQDPMTSLDPTMRIGNQIKEAILVHSKISAAEAKAEVLNLLHLVGIDEGERRSRQYPHEFSGGQRQRIVIAIALAARPKLLIADEPTTALDVTMQEQIIDLIKGLQSRLGMSVIFITHDLGVVSTIADRVAVMYAGRIVETGLVDEVFNDPRHPYTWGLLKSLPSHGASHLVTAEGEGNSDILYSIPGSPPIPINLPPGDPFAPRNDYALVVDDYYEPPLFKVTDTHFAATWLLDPRAPALPAEAKVKR
jgi:oligopeptide transport system ATP-binding protein